MADLSARSVIASTLLGTVPPRLPGRLLVAFAGEFGIQAGTTRTALSRMVDKGELRHLDGGQYELDGDLLAPLLQQLHLALEAEALAAGPGRAEGQAEGGVSLLEHEACPGDALRQAALDRVEGEGAWKEGLPQVHAAVAVDPQHGPRPAAPGGVVHAVVRGVGEQRPARVAASGGQATRAGYEQPVVTGADQ